MEIVGILVLWLVLGAGIYWLITNVAAKSKRSYRYETFTDVDGKTIEKVIEVEED